MQKGRVFEYANTHASEVWVMYGGENERWSKFVIGKKGAIPILPTEPKNTSLLLLKLSKVSDVKKLVDKYSTRQKKVDKGRVR